MVAELWRADRGFAIDRSVLDSLYDISEERGFEVYLVTAQHTKNLPGRKSDVQESQWLLKLHTYGLGPPWETPAGSGRRIHGTSRRTPTNPAVWPTTI
jgi:hypothetical protein